MSLLSIIKDYINKSESTEQTFADYKSDKGVILRAESLEVGKSVTAIEQDGEVKPEDGTYTITEQNMKIVIVDGLIETVEVIESETEDVVVEASEEGTETPTNPIMKFMDLVSKAGVNIQVETSVEGVLSIGDKVTSEGADLTDGFYDMEDGSAIIVSGSKISGILSKEAVDSIMGAPSEEVVVEAKSNEFSQEGPSAYIELPTGVHTIGDKVYTVIEQIENKGTDNEYTHNVILSIVPLSLEQNSNQFSKEDNKIVELEKKLKDIEEKFNKASVSGLDLRVDISKAVNEKPNKTKGTLSSQMGY